jgi:two-component sensor histidine kinase|tara:strand:+ start:65 stop:703 length:639 start_codon:yes stop_codon:yes gene_type:complete
MTKKNAPEHSHVVREIHHRVKNNLQIIASIMRLQLRQEDSPAAQSALSGAIQRLMGMMQVHDLLARVDVTSVDLKELLGRLLELNIQTFLLPGQVIRHEVRGAGLSVPPDPALSVALAVNELIINAIKHGFAGRKEGRVDIELSQTEGEIEVRVVDNGIGLEEGFSLTGSSHLGLRLVQSVIRDDLKGQFEVSSKEGVSVLIRFPSKHSGPS